MGLIKRLAQVFLDEMFRSSQINPEELERILEDQCTFPIIAKVDVLNDLDSSFKVEAIHSLFKHPYYCVNYYDFTRYGLSNVEQLVEFNSTGINYTIIGMIVDGRDQHLEQKIDKGKNERISVDRHTVEQIAHSGLMEEKYFISPRFKFSNENSNREYDNNDTFGQWLVNNSFYFGHGRGSGGGDHTGFLSDRRLFSGLDGVLCEIKHTVVSKNFERQKSKCLFEYSRVMRIRYLPSYKKIPIELMNKLIEFGYKESLNADSDLMTGAREMFNHWV